MTDRPWLYALHPCPRCGRGFRAVNLGAHERICLVPYTLERLYEIGGVVPGDPDECWEWQGTRDPYGKIASRRTHVLALELHLGRKLGEGMRALHTCDNPPCVNVSHLYEGTQRDNVRDGWERGRMHAPEVSPEARAEAARKRRERRAK